MRRPMLLIPAATLGLLAFLPPVAAEESVVAGFTGIQTHAQGQAATGYVTALGYQGYYRPDCWTPLLVHLDSSLSTPEELTAATAGFLARSM